MVGRLSSQEELEQHFKILRAALAGLSEEDGRALVRAVGRVLGRVRPMSDPQLQSEGHDRLGPPRAA